MTLYSHFDNSQFMKLFQMSDSEYAFWYERSLKSYAQDKKLANNLTDDEATKTAIDSFNRYLPDGLKTKDQYLFTAKDSEENILGYVWFNIRGPIENLQAYIFDIIVETKFRGMGYGKQLMLLTEQKAISLGANRIGLHVFGYNTTAINLYKSLNYQTTDLVMEKKLIN